MTRGLIIDGIHTYNSWGLILTKNDIGLPQPKFSYVDIPSGDGSLDLTEALTGEISYGDRLGGFEFDLLNHWLERASLIERIGSHIHGRKVTIYLPDDPDWYYIGRLSIRSFDKNKTLGKLIVDSTCEPYKYKTNKTHFNFTIGSTGVVNTNCPNSRKRVIPQVTASAEVTISIDNTSISVSAGTYKFTNLVFTEGDNPMVITGAQGTTVKFEYQEGAL